MDYRQGIYRIALKMLFRDRVRYIVLLGALAFSTFLMTQQSGLFCGLMHWTTAAIRNLDAPIWIMDSKVDQVDEPKPLKDTDYTQVRSIEGVAWAVPIYYGVADMKLANGDFKAVVLNGLDTSSLIGHPGVVVSGSWEDIRLPNSIVLDTLAVRRFGIKVGDRVELNEHEAVVVAIVKANISFNGLPYVYTTFDRIAAFVPMRRKLTSYILAAPMPNYQTADVTSRISKNLGLLALSNEAFYWKTIIWYVKNTSIPMSLGITVAIGFIVGLTVCAQTFYAFIMDNLRNFAALKAMGATSILLLKIISIQLGIVGLLGFGSGLAFSGLFGLLSFAEQPPPFYLPPQVIAITFSAICIICLFTLGFAWRKVRNIEADMVFRG